MGKSIPIRLGTRGSELARAQSRLIADALEKREPKLRVELIIIKTTGDRVQDRPLADLGGKGLFTKEIEQALLAEKIDFAVHSYKDVPVTMPLVDQAGLTVAAVPEREDARDVLVTRGGAKSLADQPSNASVGTTSLRRRCQLLQTRPDLRVEPLRGNIDSRLAKVASGAFDAVILAAAGLRRAGWFDNATMAVLPIDVMLPAAGQGALALQCRSDDHLTADICRLLHDDQSAACVDAEREVIRLLDADCHSPVAAFATLSGGALTIRAATGLMNGEPPVRRAEVLGPVSDWRRLAATLASDLGTIVA